MDFYDVIKNRRSIRAYKDATIPRESLARIAESVRLAPSACNIQPWSFRIVFNKQIKDKICSVYTRDWLKQAPAIIVALGNYEECWKKPDGAPAVDIDMGIAMEHLVLAARAEGLGTCWICSYDSKKMNETLNILRPWTVLAISPLGYPAEEPAHIKRKDVSSIFQVME